MQLYPIALALMTAGGVAAFVCGRHSAAATRIGAWFLAAGAAFGIAAALAGTGMTRFFQLPVFLLAAAGAVYSPGYLAGHGEKRANVYWCFFDLTAAAMLCVTLAERPLPFLLAWEMMGLTSGALVMFERRAESARHAAWLYFAACHAGAAMLMLFFFFPNAGAATLVFALIGFGLKIGFPLLHVWLPEAHPEAPAPVSALMSGAMIALGFLGLFRFVHTPDTARALGWSLLCVGLVGAPGGIVFALPQRNLKRLLAYSSIENMGLIGIAAGLWLLGEAYGLRDMAVAGYCGVILHLLNHALLKGGLFLGAGVILKSTGTLDLDRLGGLQKRMPRTGLWFTLNAAGLSGLPPFSGFLGELAIYCAAFAGIANGNGAVRVGAFAALVTIALTGGIAAAAMTKAVAAALLGDPRSRAAAEAREAPRAMAWTIGGLFLLSLALTVLTPGIVRDIAGNAGAFLTGITARAALVCGAFTALAGILLALQHISAKRGVRRSATWDCGYARPDARMEYTGTAFTQPLADFFAPILRIGKRLREPRGFFPHDAELEQLPEDGGVQYFWRPLTAAAVRAAERCHALQSGSLHFYILLILLTVGGMLVYAMRKG